MPWEDEERRLGDRLIRLYEQAEREIVAHIQRIMTSGRDAAATIQQLTRQRRQVEAILAKLRTVSAGWSKRATVAAYTAGVSLAQQQLVAAGVAILPDLGGIHQPAMKIFAEKVRSRLMDVCTLAGRTTVDIYRAASLEASMVGSVAGYETWQQARRKILEEITGRGIYGFVDRAGKKWSMRAYAEMLARTSLMEIHNEAQWREFRAHDEDLIAISFHTGTCPRCAPWAGKVLSLDGQTPGFPTLDDAKAGGLFHPRCRHASALYVPDEGETPEETERRMSAHRQEITAREEGRRGERAEKEAKERADREREKAEKAGQGLARLVKENAVIPDAKLYRYCLDPTSDKGKHKALVFEKALGYNLKNAEDLRAALLDGLKFAEKSYVGKTQYGEKYAATLNIKGANGKIAPVITGWIQKVGEEGFTLTSAYVKPCKKGRKANGD